MPSVLGHELSGVVVELGYGTTGLTVGQRVFGLTAWQALFDHAQLRAGQTVLIHGAGGSVARSPYNWPARPVPTSSAPAGPPTGTWPAPRAPTSSSTWTATNSRTPARSTWCSTSSAARSATAPPRWCARRHSGHCRRSADHPAPRRPGNLLRRRAQPRTVGSVGRSPPRWAAHTACHGRPRPGCRPRRVRRAHARQDHHHDEMTGFVGTPGIEDRAPIRYARTLQRIRGRDPRHPQHPAPPLLRAAGSYRRSSSWPVRRDRVSCPVKIEEPHYWRAISQMHR